MTRVAAALLLAVVGAGTASAHPIEAVVTGAAMPVPRGQFDLGTVYRTQSGGHELTLDLAAGFGGWGELSIGASLDLVEGEAGPFEIGTKVLILMEGPTGIDLALAASVTTDKGLKGQVIAGRSIWPGWYLAGHVAVVSTPEEPPVFTLVIPHGVDGHLAATGGIIADAAVALQWAPVPRLIPTFEAQVAHSFESGNNELVLVPEVMWLLDMNHMSLKVAVPVTFGHDGVDAGMIAALSWQT